MGQRLGQHWLTDANILDQICRAAEVTAGDRVVEIGAGTGELTCRLLDSGAQVLALEIDSTLIAALRQRLSVYDSARWRVQVQDVRRFNWSALSADYKIVANIPYYLTAYLLRQLTQSAGWRPRLAALLVQKEVAERVAMVRSRASLIARIVELYYRVSAELTVPAALFNPPPAVDSRLLLLRRREQPLHRHLHEIDYLAILKAGFSSPRKTLLNNLAAGLRLPKTEAEQWLATACVAPHSRAGQLSAADWHRLQRHLPIGLKN